MSYSRIAKIKPSRMALTCPRLEDGFGPKPVRPIKKSTGRLQRQRGLTLIEVVISIGIIALTMIPTIATIQTARVRARTVGINLIGQNLCVSMMELIKRSGYDEVNYSEQLPGILDIQNIPNVLLDFPRTAIGGADEQAAIPEGAPGGVAPETMEAFLADARDGEVNLDSPVLADDSNYYAFSDEQILAFNGYASAEDIPEGANLLDPQFAWGVYIADDPAGAAGGEVGYPIKRIAVIVKWIDPRRNRRDFTVLESFISQVAPRM